MSVSGWALFDALREAVGSRWASELAAAEKDLRCGIFVAMHNPLGPVETCLATSAYNLVELWHEGYRPETRTTETGARKPRRVR